MDVEDVVFDVFSCVSKNELEKCELVSILWRRYTQKGLKYGILSQVRMFSKIVLTSDLYMEKLPGSCGALIDFYTSPGPNQFLVTKMKFANNYRWLLSS